MHGGLSYLGVAFLAIWVGISGYLLTLSRRQRAIDRRLKDLQSGTGHEDGSSAP
jgi:CcmD family protein